MQVMLLFQKGGTGTQLATLKALKIDDRDEMIFYNFAAALYNDGQYQKADSLLKRGLEINPDFEPILMYLGNIARAQKSTDQAIRYYERVIEVNRKYFEAYVGLSELLTDKDVIRARALLTTCLNLESKGISLHKLSQWPIHTESQILILLKI